MVTEALMAPPVHLRQGTGAGEHVEVTADGHVGDAQLFHEFGHPHGTVAAHDVEDESPPLGREAS
ncbi:hypothetical protein GCM10020254_03460 [Streptomyces goshikiensis]